MKSQTPEDVVIKTFISSRFIKKNYIEDSWKNMLLESHIPEILQEKILGLKYVKVHEIYHTCKYYNKIFLNQEERRFMK